MYRKVLANIAKSHTFCARRSFANDLIKERFTSIHSTADLNAIELPLADVLREEILSKGPITFHHYMDRCLLHEQHGYYMKKDVFNTKGDFITSPEISQMFGEMIGVWCLSLLGKINAIDLDNLRKPANGQAKKKYGLLEFGPGRGTLMIDIIRVSILRIFF